MRRGTGPGRRERGSKVGKWKNKGFNADDRVVRGEGFSPFFSASYFASLINGLIGLRAFLCF